ncbi:MAG: type II toxin-antitoxin system RelE/ParE family toxin [Campylobacterota bacterium]|nr:type II toxin-antitoxin system RelE/ParE family toxin [Campylobacterota bacterium]
MNLKISKLAKEEIYDGTEYYNLQQSGLGDSFKSDVKQTIINIHQHPKLYPDITTNIKRCVLHRFPFSIFYTIRTDTILILTVAHQHRKPIY